MNFKTGIGLLFFHISLISGQKLCAQTTVGPRPFPPGVYMSFEAIENRRPDFDCTLDVSTRSTQEIYLMPGHFHLIHKIDNCLTNKQFKKMVAYSSAGKIYFRGAFIDQEYGFFGSSATGKYLPFFYPNGMSTEQEAMLSAVALVGGLIPLLLAYPIVSALGENGNANTNVPIYFFDLENKQTYPLNNTTFMSLMRLYPDLLAEYEALDKKDIKIETYLDFLERMN